MAGPISARCNSRPRISGGVRTCFSSRLQRRFAETGPELTVVTIDGEGHRDHLAAPASGVDGLAAPLDRCRHPNADGPNGLSDNGPPYTATATVLYAHELGLVPITTPAYSPQSNGLAEAFVHTFKRDYIDGADLRDAETVLAQLVGWFEDYNTQAPHSALGMRPPTEHRQLTLSSPVRSEIGCRPSRATEC